MGGQPGVGSGVAKKQRIEMGAKNSERVSSSDAE